MMILATYKNVPKTIDCDHDEDGRVTEVFTCWDTFHKRTFSPDSKPKILINFQLGKGSYKELQAKLHDIAAEWSYLSSDLYGLSWNEIHLVQSWFRKNGKRYGLLKEFEENCIC